METDLTSIIIGLASLATFFVPIGYYELHEKKSLKEARKRFLKKASEIGFQTVDVKILRNHAAMGIGKNNEQLLYVHGNQYELVEIADVVNLCMYKRNNKNSENEVFQQIGVRLNLHKGVSVELPVFEGKEGTLIGEERIIVQHWIGKINTAQHKCCRSVSA